VPPNLYGMQQGLMADWSRKFDEPIPLPNGRELVTLKDAGEYITKLLLLLWVFCTCQFARVKVSTDHGAL
jgi:hypothetical protein